MADQEQPYTQLQNRLEGICVLLVEDEADIADLFSYVLQNHGADLIQAASAGEALQVLSSHNPDVLVCNLRLPDLTGGELLQHIRQGETSLLTRLPAIAVTSYTRDFVPQQALQSGFDYFMPKPIEAEQLVDVICTLVNSEG